VCAYNVRLQPTSVSAVFRGVRSMRSQSTSVTKKIGAGGMLKTDIWRLMRRTRATRAENLGPIWESERHQQHRRRASAAVAPLAARGDRCQPKISGSPRRQEQAMPTRRPTYHPSTPERSPTNPIRLPPSSRHFSA